MGLVIILLSIVILAGIGVFVQQKNKWNSKLNREKAATTIAEIGRDKALKEVETLKSNLEALKKQLESVEKTSKEEIVALRSTIDRQNANVRKFSVIVPADSAPNFFVSKLLMNANKFVRKNKLVETTSVEPTADGVKQEECSVYFYTPAKL